MKVLVVDPKSSLSISKYYLYKLNDRQAVQNKFWIGDAEQVDTADSEAEAYTMLQKYRYDSVIINAHPLADHNYFLEKVRATNNLKNISVKVF